MNFTKKLSGALIALSMFCSIGAHAQDNCAAAQTVTAGTHVVAAINGANGGASCGSGNASMAEWYKYTPTQNYMVTITSDLEENVCKDTHFNVYSGNCGTLVCVASDDDSGVVICPANNNSYLSTATFTVVAGTTYYIVWDNRWNASGFTWKLNEFISPCTTATPITAGTHVAPVLSQPNIPTSCSNASSAKWYSYTPNENYRVTVSSDLAANICKDTNFSVYTGGSCTNLQCITSDDNSGEIACNSGNTNSNLSVKSFDAAAGTTYYIVWDNKWSDEGFTFTLTEEEIVIPVMFNTVNVPSISMQFRMCVVDMNNDDKDDVVGISPNQLQVHHQGDNGVLTPSLYTVPGTSFMPGWSMAAGDFNKDGYNDLILGNTSGASFWLSDGTGNAYTSYTPGQYIFCQRTNFADLNNDGHLDAFSCHDVGPNVYYLNDGSNGFVHYQVGITPGAMALGGITGNYASIFTDIDNDGDTDMFVSKCSGPACELHINNGDGTYTNMAALAGLNVTPVDSWSSAIGDFDNDGDMDILIGSNGPVNTKYFRNNLDGGTQITSAFTNLSIESGWDADPTIARDYVTYDFDNDGYLDVLSANGRIMFNQGGNGFMATLYNNVGAGAIGDLNGDGFLDILNGNNIRYGVPNGNGWIRINLKGIQSNSNGIGARVEIYGPFGKQIRDIRSGEGFGFMNTLSAHFGIGQHTEITQAIIKWPSGTVDYIDNPTPNQPLTVVEGSHPLKTHSASANQFSVYPNPASDMLNIAMGSAMAEAKAIRIMDLNGRKILETGALENIPVRSLTSGVYVVIVKTADGKEYSQKFVKN